MGTQAFAHSDDLLVLYASYHRDRRNLVTHLVGIPMIVFALGVLLSRHAFVLGGLMLTPAWVAFAAVALWNLTRGDLVLGLATTAFYGVLFALAEPLAGGSTGVWLALGTGTFVVGWAFQFAGHVWEGRKPAFVDDLIGLLVGPMFVVAEALFAAGWNPPLQRLIEERAGPMRGGFSQGGRPA